MEKKRSLGRYVLVLVISLLLLLGIMVGVGTINFPGPKGKYTALKGVMDLEDWRADEDTVFLDGEWEFYPGVFLEPCGTSPHSPADLNGENGYINVPGTWNASLGKEGSAGGAGTYRLLIRLPRDGVYALKTKTIRMANRIYLNGEEIISTGEPSISKGNFRPESKYRLGSGVSRHREIDLILHVSSYGYRSGGIISPIEFGSLENILANNNASYIFDAVAISICLVLGLYFFITYLHRQKDSYLFYFAAVNLVMALYLSLMNEQLLYLVYSYDFVTRTRLQVSAVILIAVFFLRFTHLLLPGFTRRGTVNIFTMIDLALLLFLLSDQNKLPTPVLLLFQGTVISSCVVTYAYISYVLLKSIRHRAPFWEYIFIITTTFLSYWTLMALKIFGEIDLGNIPTLLTLCMLFGGAALMSHRLQEDYDEASSLSERLLRFDRLKDEFLAKASHQLHAPLQVILSLTQNLFEGQRGSLNPQQQEDLFFIQREGQRLSWKVEELLYASQIKEGNIKHSLLPLKAGALVPPLLKEMEVLIPTERNVILKNHIPQDFPALLADSDRFTRIIYNLVHNAIRYTPKGEVVVSASPVNGWAEISISDTGVGIEKENLPEIFNALYQGTNDSGIQQGLGIGLSVVKYLVESLGGEIKVKSTPGKGSTFNFTLPLAPADVDPQSEAVVPAVPIQKPAPANKDLETGPCILVVDDEPLHQKALLGILEPHSHRVLLANSGAEALQTLQHRRVDLVILDFMLPDQRGDALCREIRKKYPLTQLPVLILTSSGRSIDLMQGFQCGANDFQRKPLNAKELLSRVQSLLLMKETVEAGLRKEFQYFYSQISPHFLYNTINTIIGLSYIDNEKARRALNNLSIYFRGKLDTHRQQELVPLERELELITAYLEIEQLRYGKRLSIEYDITENLSVLLPPLTLQPLIENSVGHGIMAKKSSGIIKISAHRGPQGFVTITIGDDGQGMSRETQRQLLQGESPGLGFRNVLEKVGLLPGASIRINSRVKEGTEVIIMIPEVKDNESYPGG